MDGSDSSGKGKFNLEFIHQSGGQIQGKRDKKRIRRHAMQYSILNTEPKEGHNKRGAVRLNVPSGFGGVAGEGEVVGNEGVDLRASSTDDMNGEILGGGKDFEDATQRLMEVVGGLGEMYEAGLGDRKCFGEGRGDEGGGRGMGDEMGGAERGEGGIRKLLLSAERVGNTGKSSTSKSRTSCDGCQTRKVKCDRVKPSCSQCVQYYGACEGYTQSRAPSRKRIRALTPQHFMAAPNIEKPRTALTFEDESSSRYFQVYMSEAATELNGLFSSSFWDRVIFHETHRQPFVRQAAVAIGALNKATKADHWASLASTEPDVLLLRGQAREHRQFALKAWGDSLQKMRSMAYNTADNLRKILIASLLVFAFETFSGQPDVAFSHHLIGDRLICDFALKKGPGNSGIDSPVPHVIEDELLLTYIKVDLNMMTFTDVRGPPIHDLGKVDGDARGTIANMRGEFESLDEAKLYWELIMRRCCHYAYSSFVASKSVELQRGFAVEVPRRGIEMTSGNSIYSSPFAVTEELREECGRYVEEIDRFSQAFARLYASITSPSSHALDADAKRALCLRMYALSTRIMVAGTTFTSEMEYDHFLPEFQELLRIGTCLTAGCMGLRGNEPRFALDLGVVGPFFLTLLRSRDREVRRGALAVLRRNPNREAAWDRAMMAEVGAWVMGIEERGLVEGERVAEERRVRLCRMVVDMDRRRAVVQCVRRKCGDTRGGLEWEEAVIDVE